MTAKLALVLFLSLLVLASGAEALKLKLHNDGATGIDEEQEHPALKLVLHHKTPITKVNALVMENSSININVTNNHNNVTNMEDCKAPEEYPAVQPEPVAEVIQDPTRMPIFLPNGKLVGEVDLLPAPLGYGGVARIRSVSHYPTL